MPREHEVGKPQRDQTGEECGADQRMDCTNEPEEWSSCFNGDAVGMADQGRHGQTVRQRFHGQAPSSDRVVPVDGFLVDVIHDGKCEAHEGTPQTRCSRGQYGME